MATEKPFTQEVAYILGGRDITRGFIDSLPYIPPTDRILNFAGGWKGYEELLRDDQVQACFSQRRLAVVRKPWIVEAGGTARNDKNAAKLVEETLKALDWDAITDQMLYARIFGYSVAEILWSADSSGVHVIDIRVRDRSRFVFAPDGCLRMLTMSAPQGEALPERKFWVASVGASHHDEPYGRGLANALYWPVWFKRNGAKFWSIFLEKFGAPTPIGKFPKGTEESERNKLLQVLQAIQTDAAAIIPEGMVIELLEATRGGNAGYENWMSYWDHAISKIILGQTMTTDNGSSMAQAQVHMEVREDFVASDADLICASAAETWVKWLVEYNIPGAEIPAVWRETEVQEDLKTRSDRDKALHEQGYRLKPEAVKRIYGDDYEFVGDATAPTGSAGIPASSGDAVAPIPAKAGTQPDTITAAERGEDLFPDQAALDEAVSTISAETLDAQGRALLAPIMEALQNADDNPEAFLGWLAEQFPNTDPGALEDMLTRLIFISELWGRLSAQSPFEGGTAERRGMSPDA